MTKLSRTHPIVAPLPFETPIYTAREQRANERAGTWAAMWNRDYDRVVHNGGYYAQWDIDAATLIMRVS